MHAHVLTSMNDLQEGLLGIPTPSKESPIIAPQDIDLVVVPCLACDTSGYRIGYGGGYYDRYLASARQATSVALCRESLLLEQVPREAHDIPVDIVITNARIISVSAAAQ